MRPLLFTILLAAGANAIPIENELQVRSASPQGKSSGSGDAGKILVLFARGTAEVGTLGVTVGPALQRAMNAKFPGRARTEGVPYPADFAGATTGAINPKGAPGAVKMAEMARTALGAGNKVVLSGYSQGAEQVHGALMNLGADGARITAAVTFGDPLKPLPNWGRLPKERAKIFCHPDDGVCGMAFSISAAHMAYTSNGDIGRAVEFIQGTLK